MNGNFKLNLTEEQIQKLKNVWDATNGVAPALEAVAQATVDMFPHPSVPEWIPVREPPTEADADKNCEVAWTDGVNLWARGWTHQPGTATHWLPTAALLALPHREPVKSAEDLAFEEWVDHAILRDLTRKDARALWDSARSFKPATKS